MADIDDLVKDFAFQRIATEAPYDFHKIDIEDVIQVYMDLFGTDPADDIVGMNKGGMMNINRMTAPLGYALGGPAGMVGRPTSAPESYEGFEPVLGDWMKDRKMRQAQPPAGAVDMTGQYVAPPERPRWEKARELGKKGLEGIKKLGSKSLGALKYAVEELIGAGAAEGSEYYISPDEAKGMTKEELEKEIHGFNPYEFGGQGYSWKNLRTIQIVIDELMSRLGDD